MILDGMAASLAMFSRQQTNRSAWIDQLEMAGKVGGGVVSRSVTDIGFRVSVRPVNNLGSR